jgi:dTDP-4-dehydrorhamnose 3,5-epimerase
MIFSETKLKGAFIIEVEKREDERGFFARAWCKKEFEEHGLAANMVQSNIAFSKRKGTLRGLHYQGAPYGEVKVVRCTKGSLYDVLVDLRPGSSTYRQWVGVELTSDSYKMMYVPEGFAHGYQTLEDNTEVTYQVSQLYSPDFEQGIRYDDPAIGIDWPLMVKILSDKDKGWPDCRLS